MKKARFLELTKKYGKYGSWAIWDSKSIESTEIISKRYKILHSKYIFVALNKSFPSKEAWQNFRGLRRGSHDRKLVMALNVKPYKGSYMTDLFKNTCTKSVKELKKQIKTGKINIKTNVKLFTDEINDINISNKTKFIIFGKFSKKMFTKYFQIKLKINPKNIIYYEHYSSTHKTDRKWVSGLYKVLNFE